MLVRRRVDIESGRMHRTGEDQIGETHTHRSPALGRLRVQRRVGHSGVNRFTQDYPNCDRRG
jgi:hypothetical protein